MNNANIMGRRMFRPHSAPVAMQAGGMAQMMPPGAMMPPGPPPGPPPGAMMPPTEEEGVATLMAEQGIDPAMMEQMLASASENFGNLDTAEDFEQAMNAIRGDQASVTERRGELAELVGPEDANRTPESVLTLVQPVMMLAEVDQGIGGLAQGEMTEPVTGEMAGGIMSTVDMGGAPEAPAPVNFNQGGAVQRFASENEDRVAGTDRIRNLFTEQQQLYRDLITPTLTAEDLAENKRLTEAQILFDLANAGLRLAQPGPPGENFLGAVTRAGADSQFFDKFGARAAEQRKLERASRAEKQAVDLAALQSAEKVYGSQLDAETAMARILASEGLKNLDTLYTLTGSDGTVLSEAVPVNRQEWAALQKQYPGITIKPYKDETEFGTKATEATVNFLTDINRLGAYASGAMNPQDKTQFEQVVLDYLADGTKASFDHTTGKTTFSRPQLAPTLLEALETGDKGFYNRIMKITENEGKPELKRLADATVEMFNPDGTLNTESEVWSLTKPNKYDPEIDYGLVLGLSRVVPGISKTFGEAMSEITGEPVSLENERYAEAQLDLTALANQVLQLQTNMSDDRVLKFVQEQLAEEVKGIRSGGILTKTDADAKATINTLIDIFAEAMQLAAMKLPKYGGDGSGLSKAEMQKTDANMSKLKLVMNELLAFRGGFARSRASKIREVSGRDQSADKARQQLLDMLEPD
jgi:hypothetical protein